MRTALRNLVALGLVVLAAPVPAQDASQPLEIHGFGGWSYGRTTQNRFLAGTPDGDFQQAYLAVNLFKRLDERLTIHAQAAFHNQAGAADVVLEYAFANYKLNDHLTLRVGQVKHPFGIYTEVFDVGTLRPFIDLPQGFYGPVGFAGETYRGLGAAGAVDIGTWTVAYDAYAGGNEIERFAAAEHFLRGSTLQVVSDAYEDQSNRNVVGGRVVLQTPIQGLSFGGSSYTGIVAEAAAMRYTVVAGQVGYRSNVLTLESEVAHSVEPTDEVATGGYVLAAYRFTPEWQVAAQFDDHVSRYLNTTVTAAPSLANHREGALAISRWLSRAFVLKAEYHRVSGNRLAMPHPENLVATIAANELRTITHLVQFGAQFTF